MRLDFLKVVLPAEMSALLEFDSKIFKNPGDAMFEEDWVNLDSYWMVANDIRVGCCALLNDTDYDEQPRPGYLWIVSIGILPQYQGRGFGTKFTKWQIEYARRASASVLVTNTRESNRAMRAIYETFGFTTRCIVPYYEDP